MTNQIISTDRNWKPSLPTVNNGVEELIGLSFAEYRAHPAIAQSDLKLAYSDPQLYYETSSGLWSKPPPTKSMEIGIEAERRLRNGMGAVTVIPTDVLSANGRRSGKKWEEFAAAHDGETLIKESEYRDRVLPFESMIANAKSHASAAFLLYCESVDERLWSRKYTWMEDDIQMKCEIDLMLPKQKIMVDIKTTKDERPAEFARSICNFRYDVQAAQYLSAIEMMTDDQWSYYWLCIRNSPPYSVSVIECDDEWRELGAAYRRSYIDNFKKRSRTGEWRSSDDPQICDIPRFERGPTNGN